jgi:hypothetical protein
MKPIQDYERPRLLADENFNVKVTEGLRLHYPDIDILTIQEAQQLHIKDPELLNFAQKLGRIVLTHDKKTMPKHLADLLAQLGPNETSPGVWIIEELTPIGVAIQAIAEYWGASRQDEWRNLVTWIA